MAFKSVSDGLFYNYDEELGGYVRLKENKPGILEDDGIVGADGLPADVREQISVAKFVAEKIKRAYNEAEEFLNMPL